MHAYCLALIILLLVTNSIGLTCNKWLNAESLAKFEKEAITCSTAKQESCLRATGIVNVDSLSLSVNFTGGICWDQSACASQTCQTLLTQVVHSYLDETAVIIFNPTISTCDFVCCSEDNCNNDSIGNIRLQQGTASLSTTPSLTLTTSKGPTTVTLQTAAIELAVQTKSKTTVEQTTKPQSENHETSVKCSKWLNTDIINQPEENVTCSSMKGEICLRAEGNGNIATLSTKFIGGLCWKKSDCSGQTCKNILTKVASVYLAETLFSSFKPTFSDCDFICCDGDYCNKNFISDIRWRQRSLQIASSTTTTTTPASATTLVQSIPTKKPTSIANQTTIKTTKTVLFKATSVNFAVKRESTKAVELATDSLTATNETGVKCSKWLNTDIINQPEENVTCSSMKGEICLRAEGSAAIAGFSSRFVGGLCWKKSNCDSQTCEDILTKVASVYLTGTPFKPKFSNCEFVCCNKDYCNRNSIRNIRLRQSQLQIPTTTTTKSTNQAASRADPNHYIFLVFVITHSINICCC